MSDIKTTELRSAEIICIMLEEFLGIERPPGLGPEEALDQLREQAERKDEGEDMALLIDEAAAAADRIIGYFVGQLQAGGGLAGVHRHEWSDEKAARQ